MRRKVTIGTKSVEMVANAATPVFYNLVFHRDFFTDADAFSDEFAKTGSGSRASELYGRIGFICANQAKKDVSVKDLTFEDYIEWLEQFMIMDLAIATDEIADLYYSQAEETAKPKK